MGLIYFVQSLLVQIQLLFYFQESEWALPWALSQLTHARLGKRRKRFTSNQSHLGGHSQVWGVHATVGKPLKNELGVISLILQS